MTDRVKGLYVVLDKDYRVDDVEAIMNAIRMVKGVVGVENENLVTDMNDYMARSRVRSDLASGLTELVREVLGTKS